MENTVNPPLTSPRTVAGTSFPIIPRRILIVEDHESTATILQRLLQRHGHRVWTALSYQEALAAAEANPIDVLICDLGLPDGDGCDLMRELCETRNIHGIVLSGHGEPADLQRSRDAGFSAHLVKPLDVTLIEHTLSEIFADQSLDATAIE